MAWRVGMKAVCIDASRTNSWDIPELEERRVYEISRITSNGNKVWLHLVELPVRNVLGYETKEIGFAPRRFRPLVDRKTDISFAHEILRTVTKPAPVDREFDLAMADAFPDRRREYVEKWRDRT